MSGRVRAGKRFYPSMTRLLVLALLVSGCDRKKVDAAPPPPPVVSETPRPAASTPPKIEKVEIPEVRVRPGRATTVKVRWITPSGTAVNDDAPFRVRWNRSDGLAEAPADVKSTGSAVRDGFKVDVRPLAPNATLDGEIHIVVCDAQNHSVCLPVRRSVELGFIATNDAGEDATVAIPLPSAR